MYPKEKTLKTPRTMANKKRRELITHLFGNRSINDTADSVDIGDGLTLSLERGGRVAAIFFQSAKPDSDRVINFISQIDAILLSEAEKLAGRLGNWRSEGFLSDN